MSDTHSIVPINLADASELDSLVEHRRVFALKECQLNIFETYHRTADVRLSFDGLVVSSMMRGRKVMSLADDPQFDFVPGESVILPEGVAMKVDFPDADMQHPVQCATLALDNAMVQRNLEHLNAHYPNPEHPFEWKLDFRHYHFRNNRELAASINKLISISMEDHAAKDALADLSLKFLLLRIIQTQNLAVLQEHKDPRDLRLAPVVDHIRRHLAQHISVDGLARLAGMSRPVFFRTFKASYGITPLEHVLHERIRAAKELLADPSLSVSEVCYRSGFNNLNYFIRQFKRIVGLTPTAFRLQ